MDFLDSAFAVIAMLVVTLIVLAVVVAPVLSIVAFYRTRSLAELRRRLERLEDRLIEERRTRVAPPPIPKAVTHDDEEPIPEAPRPRPRPLPRPITRTPTVQESVRLESFIGKRVLGWVAAALLVLAASFFLNYAFQSKMIGPAGQVAIGALIGTAMCAWGYQRHARGAWITCRLLTGTGVVVLFLSIYASFSLFGLLNTTGAGIYLVLLMGQAAALAVLYRSPTIAYLAVGGALLTPLLIRSQGDPYRTYFIYLAVLNIVVQGLFLWRPWPGLRALALLGTQLLFWLWFDDRYHPEKANYVVAFHLLLTAVYLVPDWLASMRRRWPIEDWCLLVMVPWFLFFVLRRVLGEFYPSWMGSLALVMAMVHTLFVVASRSKRFTPDPVRVMILAGTALAFLGLSFPLQAKSYWATAGWAVEGAALWWLGLRVRASGLRGAGVVFLVLAFVGAIYVMIVHAPETPYVPVFNKRTLAVLAAAAGLFVAAWSARMFETRLELPDQVVRYGTGLIGIGLVWLVLSLEVWDGVELLLTFHDELMMHTALSFAWAIYAGILLAIGFKLNHAPTRWTALGLFSVTLLKLLFYDLSELQGVYRVLTFLVAAIVLAAATWAYRRIQLALPSTSHEVQSHE